MSFKDLPTLNACLNATTVVFLSLGYINIKTGNRQNHKRFMTSAVVTSILFLISYLCYHFTVGSVPYSRLDWTRYVYYSILIPHIILAMVIGPFIIVLLWYVYKEKFLEHKRLARWVWPVWIFVSVSGILIYLMLYKLH